MNEKPAPAAIISYRLLLLLLMIVCTINMIGLCLDALGFVQISDTRKISMHGAFIGYLMLRSTEPKWITP